MGCYRGRTIARWSPRNRVGADEERLRAPARPLSSAVMASAAVSGKLYMLTAPMTAPIPARRRRDSLASNSQTFRTAPMTMATEVLKPCEKECAMQLD